MKACKTDCKTDCGTAEKKEKKGEMPKCDDASHKKRATLPDLKGAEGGCCGGEKVLKKVKA